MRKSKNKSIIENYGGEHLKSIIEKSSSVSDVLRSYGLTPNGSGSRTALKRICSEWNIDLIFTVPRKGDYSSIERTFEEIFCENSNVVQSTLKRAISKYNILDFSKCSICGINNVWNKKQIIMILDHINGKNTDNRIENLRFVCPNCNSQLSITGSRNKKKDIIYKKPIYNCGRCGKKVSQNSSYCSTCVYITRRKVERPTEKQLNKDLLEMSYLAVGRKYGVTDNTIRKWLKYYKKQRAIV